MRTPVKKLALAIASALAATVAALQTTTAAASDLTIANEHSIDPVNPVQPLQHSVSAAKTDLLKLKPHSSFTNIHRAESMIFFIDSQHFLAFGKNRRSSVTAMDLENACPLK